MHGVLVLDKPPGVSSHDALAPVKRMLGKRVRIGHAGTLDPFATGVLVALLGDATRLAELAMLLPKTYDATVRFGEGTDTLDPTGEVTATADPGADVPDGLDAVLAGFTGEFEQVPPAHSAVKVEGRRAYQLARNGQEPEIAPRPVTVHSIERTGGSWPDVDLRIVCGAGTYIRSLARDVGAALGLPAHLVALRRTAIGPFSTEDAIVPGPGLTGTTARGKVLPPVAITRAAGLPEVRLEPAAARHFARGGSVPGEPPAERTAMLFGERDLLLGLGRPDGRGGTCPAKVFPAARDEILP